MMSSRKLTTREPRAHGMRMMLKPKAYVRVITWSKYMRMKRRFEVQISEGDEDDGVSSPIAIARFESLDRAEAFASALAGAISALKKEHSA